MYGAFGVGSRVMRNSQPNVAALGMSSWPGSPVRHRSPQFLRLRVLALAERAIRWIARGSP